MIKENSLKIFSIFVVLLFFSSSSLAIIKNSSNDEGLIDDIGWYTSIEIDSGNKPHISYYHYTNGDLEYASFNGEDFEIEVVDSNGDVGRYTCLKFDNDDLPHISYYDKTNGDLKYAYFNGESWSISKVDEEGNVGLFNSLALDSSNHPHISYVDYDNHFLKYAHFDGNDWIIETVDSEDVGLGEYFSDTTSIAIDSNDFPHISYCYNKNFDLKYANYDGNNWNFETVDTLGDVGQYSSLKLDSNDDPHISYGAWSNFDLKYAYYSNDRWIVQKVDSSGDVRKWIDLELDNDEPIITYYDYSDGDLKIAYLKNQNWENKIIDSAQTLGCFNSLVIDDNENSHVSYYDWSNKALKYATGKIISGFTKDTIKKPMLEDFVDQEQSECGGYSYPIDEGKPLAQEFVTTYPILTRIELMIVKRFNPGSLIVSIRKDLDGEDLAILKFEPNEIAEDMSWKLFDFSDIEVEIGEKYYIVCNSEDTQGNDMYFIYFDTNNKYPQGSALIKNGQWDELEIPFYPDIDYGFKTYGIISHPPTRPDIRGPTKPKAGEEYEYKFISYDEDNDDLFYEVEWKENDIDTYGPYQSGVEIRVNHTWEQEGDFTMKVIARDTNDVESKPGTLDVKCPKNKSRGIPNVDYLIYILRYIFERFFKLNFQKFIV
jgi:hypothetical protein